MVWPVEIDNNLRVGQGRVVLSDIAVRDLGAAGVHTISVLDDGYDDVELARLVIAPFGTRP